jgi:hypothetical protein
LEEAACQQEVGSSVSFINACFDNPEEKQEVLGIRWEAVACTRTWPKTEPVTRREKG